MKISIITPTYNSENTIEKTINSIRRQSYSDWEYIVIDGNSTDSTLEIVSKYVQKDNRIHYISEPDDGIYNAMNKGIRLVTGDYVLFMGSGDKLYTDYTIANVVSEIGDNRPDIAYGYVFFDTEPVKKKYKHMLNFMYTIRFRPVSHQAVFALTSCIQNDCFDEKYKVVSDQDWLMRQLKLNKKIQYLDMPICLYDVNGYSSNPKGEKLAAIELQEIITDYYPFRSLIYKFIKQIRRKNS